MCGWRGTKGSTKAVITNNNKSRKCGSLSIHRQRWDEQSTQRSNASRMHSTKSGTILQPTSRERARTLGVNALLLLYSFFSRFPRTTIYLPPFPWTGKDSVFFLPFTVPSLSQDSDPPNSSFESAHPRSCVPHIKNIPVDRLDEAVFTADRKRNIS